MGVQDQFLQQLQHVWKCVGLWAGLWIKWKFQDTSIHHTSLTSWTVHWSHYLLLKEKVIDSEGYVVGAKVKSSLHEQMMGYL